MTTSRIAHAALGAASSLTGPTRPVDISEIKTGEQTLAENLDARYWLTDKAIDALDDEAGQ